MGGCTCHALFTLLSLLLSCCSYYAYASIQPSFSLSVPVYLSLSFRSAANQSQSRPLSLSLSLPPPSLYLLPLSTFCLSLPSPSLYLLPFPTSFLSTSLTFNFFTAIVACGYANTQSSPAHSTCAWNILLGVLQRVTISYVTQQKQQIRLHVFSPNFGIGDWVTRVKRRDR